MVRDDLDSGTWANFANNGTAVNGSDALGEILKKNRYNLVKMTEAGLGVSYSPLINASDIVWYFPAVDEFNSTATVVTPIDKNGWSSTAVSGATNALLGNGTSVDRNTKATIRARRTR